MKKKFVLASKVVLGIFLLLLFVIVMDIGYAAEGKSTELSMYVLLPCLFCGGLAAILLLIEFVLEIRESWKEKGIRLAAEIMGQVVIVMVAVIFCEMVIFKEKGNIRGYLIASIGVVMMSKILDYWKRIRKS